MKRADLRKLIVMVLAALAMVGVFASSAHAAAPTIGYIDFHGSWIAVHGNGMWPGIVQVRAADGSGRLVGDCGTDASNGGAVCGVQQDNAFGQILAVPIDPHAPAGRYAVTATNFSIGNNLSAPYFFNIGVPGVVTAPRILRVNPVVGQVANADPGSWTVDGAYHEDATWQSCYGPCVNVGTGWSYTPQQSDLGHVLRLSVTMTDNHGTGGPYISAPTNAVTLTGPTPPPPTCSYSSAPKNTAWPTLSTTQAVVGQVITGTFGEWKRACGFSVSWYRCANGNCIDLADNSLSYTPTQADVGSWLQMTVHASNPSGRTDASSVYTAPVIAPCSPITGTSAVSPNGMWLASDPGAISRPIAGANDVFSIGVDGNLWHVQWCYPSGWGGWENFGKPAVGLGLGVDVASAGPNHMDVFAIGGDAQLWHRYWNGGAWSGWESLPGGPGFVSAPTAIARPAAGAIDVFVNGKDNNVWQLEWHNGWGAWKSIGHPFLAATGGLDVLSMSGPHMDLFTRSDFDASLWHDVWNGTSWSGWSKLGGSGFTADPTGVARPDANAFDVFVPNKDGTIWRITWDHGTWSQWSSVGAPAPGVFGGADVASANGNHMDLFVRGKDLALWHNVWNGLSWSGWYTLNQPARS